jgi:hypothetical protein
MILIGTLPIVDVRTCFMALNAFISLSIPYFVNLFPEKYGTKSSFTKLERFLEAHMLQTRPKLGAVILTLLCSYHAEESLCVLVDSSMFFI